MPGAVASTSSTLGAAAVAPVPRAISTIAEPPPPPIDWTIAPGANLPVVLIAPVMPRWIAPPEAPVVPSAPSVTEAPAKKDASSAVTSMMPRPPPPPIDWASAPAAPSPLVVTLPAWLPVMSPPSLSAPPRPPSASRTPTGACGSVTVGSRSATMSRSMSIVPPPPPIAWLLMPTPLRPPAPIVPFEFTVTLPAFMPEAPSAPARATTSGLGRSVLPCGPTTGRPGRPVMPLKSRPSVPPPPLMLSATIACEPAPSTVMSPVWLTVTAPPVPPVPPPVRPTISAISLDRVRLAGSGVSAAPSPALPPPPPMLCATMPFALAPRVRIEPLLVTVTAPPLPPLPPTPPIAISGAEVGAPISRLPVSAIPPLPPPPPIDWARMPCAPSPLVSIVPALVTSTTPPILPLPPTAPKLKPKATLSLPDETPVSARMVELLPPPPPSDWAKMP